MFKICTNILQKFLKSSTKERDNLKHVGKFFENIATVFKNVEMFKITKNVDESKKCLKSSRKKMKNAKQVVVVKVLHNVANILKSAAEMFRRLKNIEKIKKNYAKKKFAKILQKLFDWKFSGNSSQIDVPLPD